MKFKKIFTLSVSLLIAGFSVASCGNENVPLEQTLNIVEESKTLYVGSVFNIELETKNLSDEIAYISSDETIATVDSDGKVTAISVGEAIITVKSGDLSDSIKITVKERIHVDKFTLSLTEEYVQVGESLLLEYEIEPNEYSSEVYFEAIKGEDLVEISGNRVKALSSGEVTIVARCANATSNMVNFSIYDFTAVVADHEIYVGDYFAVGTSLDDSEVTEDNLTIEYEHESYLRFEEAKYGMLYFIALSMGETSFVIKLNDGRVSCPVEVTILGYNDYIGVDKDEFYENYTRATDPFDARCRTECNLMSGDISPQDQEPTIAIDQPRNGDKLYKNVFHNFDYGEQVYNVMKSDGSYAFTIYEDGAYVTLEEVAAYVFAYGDVPPNYYEDRKNYPEPYESPWGEFLRLNNSKFSGDVDKYPYEPELPRISGNGGDLVYYEIDIGTTGTDCDPSYVIGDYNDGNSINRGAARIVYSARYTNGEPITDFEDRYVFYTYNHYNDFQEYLNYENGWGEMFGNITGGSTLNKYDKNNPPSEYPEVDLKIF